MKETNSLLKEQLADSERALEEMGHLFSSTKLELDSVRENVGMEESGANIERDLDQISLDSISSSTRSNWVEDNLVKSCQNEVCGKDFNIKRRKVNFQYSLVFTQFSWGFPYIEPISSLAFDALFTGKLQFAGQI